MSFLRDDVLELVAIGRGDLPRLAEWRNDAEIRVRTREWRPLSETDQERWHAGLAAKDVMLLVRLLPPSIGPVNYTGAPPGPTPIGVVGLCHWNPRDRTAEASFYIGDPEARESGHARRALSLLFAYGFEEMGLARIYAEVYDFNEPCLKLLKKLGFTEEGRLRQHVFRGGKRRDSIMLGLLEEEWRARDR